MANAPRTSILTGDRLRPLVSAVLFELGKTNRDRLAAISSLVGADGTACLSDCLQTAFPGKASDDALKQFTNFRGDVNQAAENAGIDVSFQVDTRKRHEPKFRKCWFEERRDVSEELEKFSAEGTSDVGDVVVDNRGLSTNWPAILKGWNPLHVFVSYSHQNDKEARELVDQLNTRWKAECGPQSRTNEAVWLWGDWELHGGQEWEKEIFARMERSDVCLCLCSVESAGSAFISEKEVPYFLESGKPIVPVRLGPELNFSMPAMEPLKKSQFVQTAGTRGDTAKSYVEVRGHHLHRPRFVAATLQAIVRSVMTKRGLGREFEAAVASTANGATLQPKAIDEFFEDLADEDLSPYSEHSSARIFNLAELQTLDLSQNLPAGRVGKAVDAIEQWALSARSAPFFAVLGEVGIGKTTTLKQLTRRLLEKRRAGPRADVVPMPIFVDLRLYTEAGSARKVPTLEELLTEVIRHHWKGGGAPTLTAAEVIHAVQRDGALIIFDGLDEKIVHYAPDQARQFIRELWRVLPPLLVDSGLSSEARHGRLLLSCRSHYFKDVVSQNSMLIGENRDGLRADDYEACIILPFTEDQIYHYLVRELGNAVKADTAVALFASVHNLSDLACRPFLLSLMAGHIGELERRAAAGDRILGVSLYEQLVRQWLARDDGKHQFSTTEKLELMELLAADMFVDGARAWPWDKVQRWLALLLSGRPDIAGRSAKPAEVLYEDFRTATFVLRPDDSREQFRFAHSSLHEFFHARRLVRALDEAQPDCWSIALPSLETLDFVGQLLILADTLKRRTSLGRLLTSGDPLAGRVALRYWLIAIERGYPEPVLDAVAQLAGIDLEGWTIRGRGPGQPLPLGGVNFRYVRLDVARVEHVYMGGADLTGATCGAAEFTDVDLSGALLDEADFSGAVLRRCLAEKVLGARARWHEGAWIDCGLREADVGGGFADEGVMVTCSTGAGKVTVPCALDGSFDAIFRSAHTGAIRACAWSPDGRRIASASADKTLRVWDAESGQCLRMFSGHEDWVNTCAWSSDGRWLASGSADMTLRVWDAETAQCVRVFSGHKNWVNSCVWSPDGRMLASGSADQNVMVWEAASGRCIRVLAGHEKAVHACSWSLEGLLASGSGDGTLRVWNPVSGLCSRILVGHKNSVNACAWAPDGQRLASGSGDDTVRIWNMENGNYSLILAGHETAVNTCAWSPDGRRLLSGGGRNLVIWEAYSGRLALKLAETQENINACGWSPDGQRLVSAAFDKTVRVWHAESGKCLRNIVGGSRSAISWRWSTNGKCIVSRGQDCVARVWDAESGKLMAESAPREVDAVDLAKSPGGPWRARTAVDGSLHLYSDEGSRTKWIIVHFTDGEVASIDQENNRFIWASRGAWRHLGYRVYDPNAEGWGMVDPKTLKWQPGPKGRTRILPAEFFGPLPGAAELSVEG